MIIRSLTLRHGRLALPRATTLFRASQWRRCLATEAPTSQIESSQQPPPSLDNASREDSSQDPTIAQWNFFQHQKAHTSTLGGVPEPHYKPFMLLANPPRPQDITLELLLASQSHLGHATSLWNPANAKYIFGIRGDHDPIHIISLDVTAAHLRRACKVVQGVAAKGGLILFVGTRRDQARCVVRAAELARGCHLFDKWTPGTLTNGQQILGRCKKKAVNEVDEEVVGFEPQLKYSSAVKPDLVVCLNPLENYTLLHECGIHNIPTIGIIDTDANPTWVTYPIPANDDSLRCVQVIAGALGRAGEEGQAQRLARAQAGHVDYAATHGLEMPTKDEFDAAKRAQRGISEHDEDAEEDELLFEAQPDPADEDDVFAKPSSNVLAKTEDGISAKTEDEPRSTQMSDAASEVQASAQNEAAIDGLTDVEAEDEQFGTLAAEDMELLSAKREENADVASGPSAPKTGSE
ncbi:hypothetical protein LTR95_000699 [Oleoguttula sp. CCFEE 5521]